ncbi:MAG: peptidylprolyl isomerase [Marinicella sp.]|nr:peptidylprolyl isomerase [Xanthomonadales bacterium]
MKKFTILVLFFAITKIQATTVRFDTNMGTIDIELFEDEAPITTQNFLGYVNRGDYNETVFHRLVPFGGISVIQGGAYRYNGSSFSTVSTQNPITNEAGVSNTVGTISMARTSEPHSATNQFFFNLTDNLNLNPTGSNAGYAVFGVVVQGLDVLKTMGSVARFNLSSNLGAATSEFPVYQYFGGGVAINNVIRINRAYVLSETFQINAGLSGAWYDPATDGQGIYIEVLPATGQVIMAWFTYDTEFPDDMTPSEIGYAGNRWLVAIGDFSENEFNGTVYQTSNGKFDDPAPVTNEAVGTVSLTFNSCAELVMNYSLYAGTLNGMNSLQKISGANIELCQRLASEANQGIAAQ